MLGVNGANIKNGNDTKVSDLKSLTIQRQESKYSQVQKAASSCALLYSLRDYIKRICEL